MGKDDLVFKYYLSKLWGGGVLVCADSADAEIWGVQKFRKYADVMFERSPILVILTGFHNGF